VQDSSSVLININSNNSPAAHMICTNVVCGNSIIFYIDTWSAPNGQGSMCQRLESQPFAPLPVTFIGVNLKVEKNKNIITWATASESNNDRFEIERSADGRLWETIAIEKGAGSSSTISSYRIEDLDPPAEAFYRIRQVDYDGASSLSDMVRAVLQSDDKGLVCTFDPFNVVIIIDGDLNFHADNQICIFSASGTKCMAMAAGNSGGQMDINHLPPGLYFVSWSHNQERKTIKIVKS